jgi:hypothetical protein
MNLSVEVRTKPVSRYFIVGINKLNSSCTQNHDYCRPCSSWVVYIKPTHLIIQNCVLKARSQICTVLRGPLLQGAISSESNTRNQNSTRIFFRGLGILGFLLLRFLTVPEVPEHECLCLVCLSVCLSVSVSVSVFGFCRFNHFFFNVCIRRDYLTNFGFVMLKCQHF